MSTTSQKLTYLNDTKLELKDMINYGLDTGEKITSETTFRNYVKSLFDAFIKTMTYPGVLYNNLPKVTGEGTSLTLNNTVYAPMRVELSPSALEQETTSGKNQIGLRNLASTTRGGLTFSIENDVISINGTASEKVNFQQLLTSLTQTTSKTLSFYLISGTFTAGAIGIHLDNASDTQISFIQIGYNTADLKSTKTIVLTDVSKVWLYAISGSVFSNAKFKVMLSDNASDEYEQYTGGQPSPNPDYPQQIHTVSGENTVVVGNKNLLKLNEFSGTFNTTTYTTMGNYLKIKNRYNNIGRTINVDTNYFKSTRTNTYDNIQDWLFTNLLPNTTYTISCDIKTDKQSGKMTIFGKQLDYDATSTNTTFTTDSNGEFISSVFYETNQVSGTYIELSNIQLEKNNQATTYVPHQEQTYPISLGNLEYCKIGDYEDEFYKATESDTGLTAGKWYLKKNIGKVVLDGSELDWFNDGGGAPYAIHISNILLDNTKVVVMSDYFIGVSYNSSWTTYDALVSTSIQTAVNPAIKFRYTGNTGGVEGFKTWLSTHNTSVYYILKTPTYTLLSDTLQTQLEAIWRANSYEEQTNVSQENDDLPFVIKMSAIEDLG